ncbi:CDP-alcohol phosphatidyltransferase family protein [Alkalibaculum sporogenes]|uniref:CDP-alcohol phosphatidyltransferase family protein n=1 Tax=Alkalibaculum sporogenes TaxID=2655001 RepID=UPI00128E8FEA
MANVISISRILISLSLLFIDWHSWQFIYVYLMCGISDLLDGYIARKTKTQSLLGAKLDTVGDMIMFAVVLYIFAPVITFTHTLIIWLLAILSIRVLSLIIVFIKYNIFAMLHTISNKITGLLLFFIPMVIGSPLENPLIYFVCAIASVSAIEELIIHVTSKEIEVNSKSIFKR